MKSQRSDDFGVAANKRIRKAPNDDCSHIPSSVGVDLLALSRSLATHRTEASGIIAKATSVANDSSVHAPVDVRVIATAIEIYLRLRSRDDASAASDIASKLSNLAKLIGEASNTLRGHSELPLTSSLSAGLAAGLGKVPCLTEPLFESLVGLASGAQIGAHSTAATRASQARKVRKSNRYYEAVKQLAKRIPHKLRSNIFLLIL